MCRRRSSGQILSPNFNMSVFRLASLASQNTRPNPTIYNVNDCLLLQRRRQVPMTLTLTLFPSPSSFQSGTSLEFLSTPSFPGGPAKSKEAYSTFTSGLRNTTYLQHQMLGIVVTSSCTPDLQQPEHVRCKTNHPY